MSDSSKTTKNDRKPANSENDKKEIDDKTKFQKTKMLHKDRLEKIEKWRKTQKQKLEKIRAKAKEREERKKAKIQRELLRKKQIAERKEREKKIKEQARKERLAHEQKRRKIEIELKMKEELMLEKKKSKISDKSEEEDILEKFMKSIDEKNKNRKRKAKTQLSENLKKVVDKIRPNRKNILKIEKSEILGNETRYEPEDLVIKEEVSWLDKMRQKKKEIKPVNHSAMDYNKFRKNFYLEAPEITAMTDKQIDEYRKDNLEGVKIRGRRCPRPIFKWSQCGLPEKVYDVLKKYDYQEPFPIQCQALPCIMSGRDIIACAKTGSGKTLAFILPMFRHILDQEKRKLDEGPIAMVLTPTRELAKQIFAETKKFASSLNQRVVCCHGGTTVADQIADLKRGADIIVATPGRMIDMLSSNGGKVTNARRVTYLALDEADRMFDMGFEPQISALLNCIRPDRQVVMFSATFPRQIEGLVKQIMNQPIEIIIGGRSIASNTVVQTVKILKDFEKFHALLKILGENYYKGQILIFTDRQEAVDKLFTDLQKAGYYSLTLHGGMDQSDRDSMILDFKNKTRNILIATSIAARGLDVKDLNLVINYTVPNHYEDYIHRIGRTGRAGHRGYSISFITPEESRFAPDLLKALKLSKQSRIPQRLIDMAEEFKGKVERGEEKFTPSVRSSGSKGFKFDESEEFQQKLDRQRQEAVYGTSVDKNMTKDELLKRNAELANSTKRKNREKAQIVTALDKQIEAAKAGAQAIKTTINVARTTHSAYDVQALAHVAYHTAHADSKRSETTSVLRSKAEAVARSLALSQKLNALGAGATPERLAQVMNQRGQTRRLEINDYPQQARLTVASRKTLTQVVEYVDVTITQRGTYFAPGRLPAAGEEKLSLYIEGKSEMEVERALKELRRIVEEAAHNCGGDSGGFGRYQVV